MARARDREACDTKIIVWSNIYRYYFDGTHNESADALLIDRKRLHRCLHPIEASRFPHKVDREAMSAVGGYTIISSQFQTDLIGDIC